LVRTALSRGLPVQDAEDVVIQAYEKAARAYDPARGGFEPLLYKVVVNDCRYWWRTQQRWERVRGAILRFPGASMRSGPPAAEMANKRQEALLEALTPEERDVFAAWALQRHLKKGQYPATAAAASLSMSVREYENAKRRLRTRVAQILSEWGMAPRDLFSVEDDEGPRRNHA
jgi:DNA-directed RNA polymerase specialized sigma24 family protein